MSKFWKYTTFWDKVIKSLALFGPGGGVVAGKYLDDPFWIGVGIVSALVAGWLAIWMVDKDNNGIVDIFEKKKK